MVLLSWIASAVDALVPDIPWPEWLSGPREWLASAFGEGATLVGLFGLVHPLVYDVALLGLFLMAVKAIVRRLRQGVSVVTGGGMAA